MKKLHIGASSLYLNIAVLLQIMANPSDQKSTDNLSGDAAQALLDVKDEILITWESLVRKNVSTAAGLSQPILMDTLPIFVANLAQALAENHSRGLATESNNVAQEHGGERARITRYGPEHIIQEYQILRTVVEEKLKSKISLSPRDHSIIQKSFDQAIQEAMISYFLVHGRVRDQFIATLTHDLRNPLGAAKMAAEVIYAEFGGLVSDQSQIQLRSLSSRVINNLKRADRMIQNLLDTNIFKLGERLYLQLKEEDILTIVKSVVSELNDKDRARTKVIGDSAKLICDADAIWRALDNLLTNAFKYGDETADVTLRIYSKLGRVMVSVHNEGSPIPAEEQKVLFQVFRRSATIEKSGKKGWGIGLAQVRGTAESHGGSLAVDSSIDAGTTFTLDLPADATPFQNSAVT